MTAITHETLDAFVARTDELGGPGSPGVASFWSTFAYTPTVLVDRSLDPDSDRYFEQMMALYEELSNRKLDQAVTEMTPLDVDALETKESPYHWTSPVDRATHYSRLARAMRDAGLDRGARVVDMGCGWGLSSEFLAILGLRVTAIDINPLFVDLVSRRARRLGLDITAKNDSFDGYVESANSVDGVLFYECLHHAVRPRTLLARVASWLRQDGVLILAGEPIQELYWPSWGLRMDPMSIYCIRKFGWWESGWSAAYLRRAIVDSGMLPSVYIDPDPVIGPYVIARKSNLMAAAALSSSVRPGDWWCERDHLVSNRAGTRSRIDLLTPSDASISLVIHNFCPRTLTVQIDWGDRRVKCSFPPGRNVVPELQPPSTTNAALSFECNSWCPDDEIHNGDGRYLGFHLESIQFNAKG